MTKTHVTTASALAVATLLCFAPVSATELQRIETATVKVRIDDLDPATQRGARALYRRILMAAGRVCLAPLDNLPGVQARSQRPAAAACFNSAVDEAVAEVQDIAAVDIEVLGGLDRNAIAGVKAAR